MRQSRQEFSRQKLEVYGTAPLPRFGHTMTPVSKTKIILFGGATGDTGKYSITGDTYCFDIVSNTWSRLDRVSGISPSPRAAHSSSSVEAYQMVIYGGATGGGSLASDDLYLLDMRSGEDQASWMIVPVVGTTPGRRYGHTLVFQKPNLLVFAGNTGNETVNDVWSLNVEKAPFTWIKLNIQGETPKVRVYHSACLCLTGSATGMMVIFGGRCNDQAALNDTWGLRRHRDGRWDWVRAPYKPNGEQPVPRYQHASLFIGSTMMVLGGRTNQVGEVVPLEAYDTENSEWFKFNSIQRFRHACWSLDSDVYVHGGFEHETPNIPTDTIFKIDTIRLFGKNEQLIPRTSDPTPKSQLNNLDQQRPINRVPRNNNKTPEIRLASQVLVYMNEQSDEPSSQIKRVPLERLQEEGKRIGVKALPPGISKSTQEIESNNELILDQLFKSREWSSITETRFVLRKEIVLSLIQDCENIVKNEPNVIRVRAPVKIYGNLHGQYIDLLRFFEMWGEPSDKNVDGDIESFDYIFLGDYVDRGNRSLETICLLMSLKVKHPDQIFLLRGHHEDISVNSLYGFADECRQRLNEDTNDPNSVYQKINKMFTFLPLACVIEDRILCVHGGVGHGIRNLDELDAIPKPIEVAQNATLQDQQILMDVLWSDPCEKENEMGFKANTARDATGSRNIVKFGADRLQRFLADNRLSMVIRSHECVMEGYDRNSQGDLITVFSATDYCGKYKNAAAILVVKRSMEIVPRLIYPLNNSNESWIDNEESLRRRPATPPRWKSSKLK